MIRSIKTRSKNNPINEDRIDGWSMDDNQLRQNRRIRELYLIIP